MKKKTQKVIIKREPNGNKTIISQNEYMNLVSEALYDNYRNQRFQIKKIQGIYEMAYWKLSLDFRFSEKELPSERTQGNYLREFYYGGKKEKGTPKSTNMDINVLVNKIVYNYATARMRNIFDNDKCIKNLLFPPLINEINRSNIDKLKALTEEELSDYLSRYNFFKSIILPQLIVFTAETFENEVADCLNVWYSVINRIDSEFSIPALMVGKRCVQINYNKWTDLALFIEAVNAGFDIERFNKKAEKKIEIDNLAEEIVNLANSAKMQSAE